MAELTRDQALQKLRRNEKLERADLRGIDLSKAALTSATLSRADLEGANLEGTVLRKAGLKNASLREAYLVGADMQEANLENADLEGANLTRANLAGANLSRANLEAANLTGANLAGARLSFAQLGTANLTGADLKAAVLTHASLEEASLGGAKAAQADFRNANLRAATLADGDFQKALFADANLAGSKAGKAKLAGALLTKADLSGADLSGADLSDADVRHATLAGARLVGTKLTGAKVAGLVGTGAALPELQAAWVDVSTAGDGTGRITNGEIPVLLSGLGTAAPAAGGAASRYFGHGDVLRNATLDLEAGARVQIDSLFENCSINLGDGTELVVGSSGVLADCRIAGGGSITIHGQFFERESPGIVGPRELTVSSQGAVMSAVEQSAAHTRFAFERGSRLRVKIVKSRQDSAQKGDMT